MYINPAFCPHLNPLSYGMVCLGFSSIWSQWCSRRCIERLCNVPAPNQSCAWIRAGGQTETGPERVWSQTTNHHPQPHCTGPRRWVGHRRSERERMYKNRSDVVNWENPINPTAVIPSEKSFHFAFALCWVSTLDIRTEWIHRLTACSVVVKTTLTKTKTRLCWDQDKTKTCDQGRDLSRDQTSFP